MSNNCWERQSAMGCEHLSLHILAKCVRLQALYILWCWAVSVANHIGNWAVKVILAWLPCKSTFLEKRGLAYLLLATVIVCQKALDLQPWVSLLQQFYMCEVVSWHHEAPLWNLRIRRTIADMLMFPLPAVLWMIKPSSLT